MVYGTAGTAVGIVLIVVPVVVYQWDNLNPPLGNDWPSPSYPCFCVLLGGIGGTLMVPSSPQLWPTTAIVDIESSASPSSAATYGGGGGVGRQNGGICRGGYRWVGGLLGGALSSGLAYLASWIISLHAAGNIVDLPLILFCGVPGLILYSLIHQCSDYTFPPPRNNGQYDYQWIPSVEESRRGRSNSTGGTGSAIGGVRGNTNHDRNMDKNKRPSFSTASPPTARI